MNKKILIGSIITVTILIGVSFTSVVGYRSVESDVKASPLFNIRTSRAIDEESNDLSCEYVGKGEAINIQLQARDNRTEVLQRIIDSISKMDDRTFDRFINLVINKISYTKNVDKIELSDIIKAFYYLRNNPNKINKYMIYKPKYIQTINGNWAPGCGILLILWLICFYIVAFIITIIFIIMSSNPTNCMCPSVNMPCLNRNL